MKKAEELKLYAPEPKRPELDAALCMSVAEGQGMGRYIKGKVLTVAVWDKKEKPLVVWRFFGDYWTGELRGNENPTKGELSPRQIEVKPCQCLTWRTEVPATKGESELLQNYFDDRRPGYLIGIVEDALSAHARKKLKERNARQAAETQKLFENLPEPPEDFGKQVLKVCSDAGFLWVTNDKQSVIEPGGVEKKISIQRARCDSCGGEYTLSELLKHKSTATCECCGEKMQVRNAAKFLSYKPGSELWAYKSLSTVEAQSLSTTDISSLESRNVSYYTTIGSQAMVQGGKVSAGEWIDTIRFRDWLKTQIQQNVINLLLSLPKVPYTDPGIGLVQNAVTAALDAGVEAGGIARPSSDEKTGTVTPSYTITVPKAAELDAATRKTRVLPKVKWTARLAGALIAVEIGGTLNY